MMFRFLKFVCLNRLCFLVTKKIICSKKFDVVKTFSLLVFLLFRNLNMFFLELSSMLKSKSSMWRFKNFLIRITLLSNCVWFWFWFWKIAERRSELSFKLLLFCLLLKSNSSMLLLRQCRFLRFFDIADAKKFFFNIEMFDEIVN